MQKHIVSTLKMVGAEVLTLGTTRPGGDFHGTCQTPGLPDVMAFLPRLDAPGRVLLFVEVKGAGGRLRPDQARFRELALLAEVAHVVGDLDALIAWLLERGYLKANQVPSYRLPEALRTAIGAAAGGGR